MNSYKNAGVDIEAAYSLVDKIKPISKSTNIPGVLGNLGGFGGMFEIPKGYDEPVLVSGTDGVGTKLKLALDLKIHDTIGIDLVAMCVNDIITSGAKPLYFLDYYATGKLEVDVAESVIKGIAEGCKQSNMALIGGETAEMPGMYTNGEYDIAGFCVGIVEKSKIIDGSKIQEGDVLISLPSSGAHSNGFSLIRKLIRQNVLNKSKGFGGIFCQSLLTPTKIYVSEIEKIQRNVEILGISHITGGGLIENLPRIIPDGLCAQIYETTIQMNPIMRCIQSLGELSNQEMYNTFNCGIGMVVCIKREDTKIVTDLIKNSYVLGTIIKKNKKLNII